MKTTRIIGLVCIVGLAFYQFSFSQSSPTVERQKIFVNPDWDIIAEDLEEAYVAGKEELEKVLEKYDPKANPGVEQLPQEVLDLLQSYQDLLNLSKRYEVLSQPENLESGFTDEEWEILSKDINEAEAADADELEKVRRKYDPNATPEEEPIPQEIRDMLDSYQNLIDATKEIEKIRDNNVEARAKGTGRTTGHIAELSVTNNTPQAVDILPEQFYVPSNGRYQSYVGRIPEGHTIPPGATMAVPVEGYCADVHTPPVPVGNAMPPLDTWITVSSGAGPDIVFGQPSVPEPMNPPGASGDPPSVPEPMNPPGATIPPSEGVPVKLLPRDPVPSFTPELIPEVTLTPRDNPEDRIIVTFPGTDIPVEGTLDPENNPPVYGTILVEAVNKLENAYDVIRETEQFPTPYFPDPVRERESVIQQTFWVFTAALTGDDYEKDDFEAKVYGQFESTTGKPVTTLPEEQKEQVDQGVEDFWKAFQATGLEAKVISVTSPDLIDSDLMLATVSSPKCKCSNISYDVEVKRGGVEVHNGSYTSRDNPKMAIQDFKYGDAFDVRLSNISANCKCDDADCEFFPAESTKEGSPGYTETDTSRPGEVDLEMDNDPSGEIGDKGNNNCAYKDKEWNEDTKELSFTLETRDEKTNSKSVFQRIGIKGYCQLEDCRRGLCKEIIQLNFVTAK